jgi:GTPase Era involved in 16S rRNA processing
MVAYDINNAKTNAIKFCFDMNKRGLSNDENICARLEDLLHVYSLLLAARVDAIKEYIKFSSELLNTYKESINEGVIRDYLSFIKSEISKRKYLKLVAINKSQLEKWEKKLEKWEKKVPKNKELIAVFKSNNPSNKDMSDVIKAMNTEANRRFAEDNMRLSFQQMQLQNDTATYCCVMSPNIGMSHSIGMM